MVHASPMTIIIYDRHIFIAQATAFTGKTLDEAKRGSLFCCGVSNEEETFYNVVDRCQSRMTTWKSSDDEEDWNLK